MYNLLKVSFYILCLFLSTSTYAITEVTPATGGTNLCFGGGYVTLGDIRIAEGMNTDFASSPSQVTYEISSPDNFEFEPGAGSVLLIGDKITGLSILVEIRKITVTYTLASTDGGPIDGFIVRGIRVKGYNTTSSGQILRSGGTAFQNGNPSGGALNHGSLASYNYPLPVADAGVDAIIFLGNSVTIGGSPAASGSSSPYLYEWSPSAGLNDVSLENPVATPEATTTYTLLITDNNGCTDTDEVIITVDPNIPAGPTITASGPLTFCLGQNVTLTSSEASGNQWYKDGNVIAGATNSTLLVDMAGSYQVLYNNGIVNSKLSDPAVVVVNPLPADVDFVAANTTVCNGGSTTFEVLASETGISYQLRHGSSNVGSPKSGNGSSLFLPSGSLHTGTHTFTIRATNQTTLCTRILSKSINITVQAEVAAPTLSASPSNAVCGTTSITLEATSGYNSYKWYKNDILITTTSLNQIILSSISQSGFYKVKGVNNSCDSQFSNEIEAKLQPLPEQKVVSVNKPVICPGSSTEVTVAATEVGILYTLRNDLDNSPVGSSVAGTGNNILFPVGAISQSTTFNINAVNGISGCEIQMNDLATVTVNPDIIVSSNTETAEVCHNGSDVIFLTSNATGGQGALSYSWTGPDGFTSTLQNPDPFIPGSAGTKKYEVKVTDETGCFATSSVEVIVNSIPVIYLINSTENNEICHGDVVKFTASGADEYEFYVDGIAAVLRSTINIYKTDTLVNGQEVTVRGFNNKGCSLISAGQIFTVNPNPPSFFTGLNTEYCVNDGAVMLEGTPSDGVFSGNGIRGNEFIPAFAGIGTHVINYTTLSAAGCDSTYSVPVVVKNSPTADFNFANVCHGVAMLFEDISTPSTEITAWEWDFGDGSPIVSTRNPSHRFKSAGKFLVSLKVTSSSGCFNSVTKQVIVGAVPIPNFTFQQICEGATTSFLNTSKGEGILSYSWNFGDPESGASNISSLKDPGHVFSGVGAYNVSLTVKTDLCTEIITKTVHILPSIAATEFPYHEDFETGNGGWVAGGQNSSWMHGMPSGTIINVAGSGSSAWSTQANGDTYFDNEQSHVLSPCFDFTGLIRPMISLQIWSHTDKGIDGAVMQYSLDNGLTWLRLGNIGEGLEWFNQGSIISQPGGYSIGQEGWSGKDANWKTARFNLDFLKNESSVRFRIAFGSVPFNGNRAGAEGFAFDNVWVGERKKLLIVEHFTNATKEENQLADNYVNILTEGNPEDVVSIHYHTDRPQTTPINLDNTADPSARSQYYGISQTPRAVLDGNFFNGKSTDLSINHLKYRSLVEPLFDIDIDLPSTTNDQVEVNAKITSKTSFTSEVIVHIAIVEEEFFMSDGIIYKNVLKKLLPDGAGTSFSEQWNVGSSKTINANWNVSNLYSEGRPLKVIVYVQNNNTKEILQAKYLYTASKRNSVTTGINNEEVLKVQNLKIYPVPTDKEVVCSFEKPVGKITWRVTDIRGISLSKGTLSAGTTNFKIDASQYPEGMYLLHLSSEQTGNLVRKIMVKH